MNSIRSTLHRWLPVLTSVLTISALAQSPNTPPPGGGPPQGGAVGRAGRGGGGGGMLAAQMIAQADKNADQKLTKNELIALAEAWFDKLDAEKAGKLTQQQFAARFGELVPAQTLRQAEAVADAGDRADLSVAVCSRPRTRSAAFTPLQCPYYH